MINRIRTGSAVYTKQLQGKRTRSCCCIRLIFFFTPCAHTQTEQAITESIFEMWSILSTFVEGLVGAGSIEGRFNRGKIKLKHYYAQLASTSTTSSILSLSFWENSCCSLRHFLKFHSHNSTGINTHTHTYIKDRTYRMQLASPI